MPRLVVGKEEKPRKVVHADGTNRKRLSNALGSTVYYSRSTEPTSGSNEGSLELGESEVFDHTVYLSSASSTAISVQPVSELHGEDLVTQAEFEAKSGTVVSVKDNPYSAKGNGVTDDSTAFQRALNRIKAVGSGVLRVPDGTYRVDSGLEYSGSNLSVELAAGAVIDFSHGPSDSVFLKCLGGEASEVSLAEDTAVGGTTLKVSAGAEAPYLAGDWIKVGSQEFFGGMAENENDQKIGEIVRVEGVSSGTLTLAWPLAGGPYTTAQTAKVGKLAFADNITLRGGRIIGGGKANPQVALKFERCLKPNVLGMRLEQFATVGVQIRDAISALVDGCLLIGGESEEDEFYGVTFQHASQDCTVSNTTIYDFRHAVDTGGSNGPSAIPGIPRRNTVIGCHAINTASHAYHTHPGGEHFTVADSTAYGCVGTGAGIGNPSAKITGCTFKRCSGGIKFANGTTKPTEYDATANTVKDTETNGIQFINETTGGVSASAGEDIHHVSVLGNTLYNAGSGSIIVPNTATYRMKNVRIQGNVINGQTAGANAIQVVKADGVAVSDNTIRLPNASITAIRLQDSEDSKVADNVAFHGSATSTVGVRLLSAKNCDVRGNTVRGAATGITTDSESAGCSVDGNDARTCTTAYNIAGSGHIQTNNRPGVTPPNIASASEITLVGNGPNGAYKITGTSEIKTIVATERGGQTVTLIFTSTASLKDGTGNIKLKEDFTASADDVVQLVCDGTSWFGVGPPSVN